ncbi:MAG: N-acetyltransferase [Bacteroidales bacterium]|nr:N-acetyltransferase [Bacteroidales bacterium]MCL2737864.1 N-acetyltransferase [Bacteroidales bacterium]
MDIQIKEVIDRRDLRRFVDFPAQLYKDNKYYVPALRIDEMKTLSGSPSLAYCSMKLWLAYKNGQIAGRIAGIVNPRANDLYNHTRIRFGWFDFIDDIAVAKALLHQVETWGKSMGMTTMHGPLGFNTWNRQGMLIEGFDKIPPINCLYNHPYYFRIMEELGFEKELDWMQYEMNASQDIPDKVKRINELILEKYNLRIFDFKNKKILKQLAGKFFETYNESFKSVHNFIPLTVDEINSGASLYLRMIRKELTCFVLDPQDNIVAFAICFPSLSKGFQKAKGRLFPFGWFHILKAYFFYDSIDLMLNGAHPSWQKKGLSSIYHVYLNDAFIKRKIKIGISNPQVETNVAVNVWSEYDNKKFMRRRCYIKSF